MSEIIVIDDVISPTYQAKLLDMSQDYSFDWHFGPSNIYESTTVKPETFVDENTVDSFQYTHLFFHDVLTGTDKLFDFVRPLIFTMIDRFKLQEFELQRCKANMLTNNRRFSLGKYNPPHVDGSFEHWAIIYYMNDSDGDTVIFNETYGSQFTKLTEKQRITPKMGRAVCFPGKYFHASCNPINNDTRTVINIDFKVLRPAKKMVL